MKMEKVNVVYFSAGGTTKKVATTIAKGLQVDCDEYDLLRQPPQQPVPMDAGTPTIFAMPVYAGRIPALCVDMMGQFQGANTPAIAVVVYGNREYDDALLELTDLVSASGFVVIAAAAVIAQHSVFPEVGKGRPDKQDMQALATFSGQCKTALDTYTGREQVRVKGNTPYCEPAAIPLQPSGNSKCNGCGICVKLCPTKAIAADKPRKTDKSRCISCTACIAACPQKARGFRGPLYTVAGKAFENKNAARREPEFFEAAMTATE